MTYGHLVRALMPATAAVPEQQQQQHTHTWSVCTASIWSILGLFFFAWCAHQSTITFLLLAFYHLVFAYHSTIHSVHISMTKGMYMYTLWHRKKNVQPNRNDRRIQRKKKHNKDIYLFDWLIQLIPRPRSICIYLLVYCRESESEQKKISFGCIFGDANTMPKMPNRIEYGINSIKIWIAILPGKIFIQ